MSETNKTSLVLEKISNEAVDSKLDKVLNTVKKIDNRCDHLNCKKSTELFGTSCLLCKNRYCFSHSLPEIHGCYDAIRKVEREEFLHPVPLKTVRAKQEHNKAEKKLSQKIKQMELERKAKPSADKSTKKKK